jgi:DnaJ-class molecular chaperone
MASYYDPSELKKDAHRNRKHTCPNCNGDGMTEVYAYEQEQPWLSKPPADIDLCTLCMGSGFVNHKVYLAFMRRI